MKIPNELLSEKNYEGSRLIEVSDEKLTKFQTALNELQAEANPILDKLTAEYYPKIDPLYQQVGMLQEQVKEIKLQIADITKSFAEDTEKLELTEQKATLIKNKMQPLIMKLIEGQLGEFEMAKHTVVKDGKIFVEVFDEIEEKIKAVRASKATK